MYTRLKIKKEQNTCFKNPDKGRWWKHFNLRMEGLPLASDGAYDEDDAKFVPYFIYTLSSVKRSLATLRLQCLKHRNRSVKLCSIHRTNWEVTSTLTLSVQLMLWFCRMQTRLKIKKKQNTCFKTLQKGRWWEHSNLRMEGLPLTSDGAYDKHDAKFVSYFTSLSCLSLALP